MTPTPRSLLACSLLCFLFPLSAAQAEGPLPTFKFRGVALQPKDLTYSPNEDLIHPTIVKTQGRVKNPLGKYYLYYAPHKHIAASMAYADSMEGPWKEYKKNPILEGPSAPDIRWIQEKGKFYLWGHRKNSQTELWTSEDGLTFKYHSVSITARNIGTRNATYSRTYEYPLQQYGSKYIMLYSGFIEDRGIRCIWLAHSKDAEQWVQLRTPLVEPIKGEMNDCYGASFLRWKGRNYVVYQDHTSWRGGNIKYVEVDKNLSPVGSGGKRYVLLDPPDAPPLNNRYRGAEFYVERKEIYMYSSASKAPRLIVYATAEIDGAVHNASSGFRQATAKPSTRPPEDAGGSPEVSHPKKKPGRPKRKEAGKVRGPKESVPLNELLKGFERKTVYEASFDKPVRMIRESELLEGDRFARKLPENTDWVLEGNAEVAVKKGRLHLKNDSDHCVFWNTRVFPESFVAEWDFQHHAPQGTAIIFFAAHGQKGGSIFTHGLPKRGGRFGNYTKGEIDSYHTSYSATDEKGVPRGSTHLKKNGKSVEKRKLGAGWAPIDGKMGRPFRIRLAKLGNRLILEINGKVSFDVVDESAPYHGGQIGFRQMRHTLEASYGGFRVQSVKPKSGS